jgi:hypothetical protein
MRGIDIGTADGLLIQRFVDPDHTPTSSEVASTCANTLAVATKHSNRAPRS